MHAMFVLPGRTAVQSDFADILLIDVSSPSKVPWACCSIAAVLFHDSLARLLTLVVYYLQSAADEIGLTIYCNCLAGDIPALGKAHRQSFRVDTS
jgi:hypothetical protein